MGMVACFVALSPTAQRELVESPDLIESYLYPEDGDGELENSVDIDKAWHGLHYLLTGKSEGGEPPLAWAILGGQEIGGDVGFGAARFVYPEQVKQIAEALTTLDEKTLRSRFDPDAMKRLDIYPEVIWVRDQSEALDYLIENYQTVFSFYLEAAKNGAGVITWLC